MSRINVHENDVFCNEKYFRRVIGVMGEHVRYSRGGDGNRTCRLKTFRRWVSRTRAKLIHKGLSHEA